MTAPDIDHVTHAITQQLAERARQALTRATTAHRELTTALQDSADAQRRANTARAQLRAAVTAAAAANITTEHLESLGIHPRSYRHPPPKTATKTATKKPISRTADTSTHHPEPEPGTGPEPGQ